MEEKRKVFLLIIACICLSGMANIKYSYDSLGRVSSALYPDGTKITYNYDKNGNIESCIKEKASSTTELTSQSGDTTEQEETKKTETNTEKENSTRTETTTEKKDTAETETTTEEKDPAKTETTTEKKDTAETETMTEKKDTAETETTTEKKDPAKMETTTEEKDPKKMETTEKEESATDNVQPGDDKTQAINVVTGSKYEAIKNYNLFKKKKPVIRSLKIKKKKKKNYLKITVKRVNKSGLYQEKGYQIKYATNSKFKKSKTVKITDVKKIFNLSSRKFFSLHFAIYRGIVAGHCTLKTLYASFIFLTGSVVINSLS